MDDTSRVVRAQAFLIQYRNNPARGEIRNVAVALITESGDFGAVRHLPPSQVAEKLRERGLLDSALVGLARTIADHPTDAIQRLDSLRPRFSGSLLIGPPMPTDAGGDPSSTLTSLYRALVARKVSRSVGVSRGALLDRAVSLIRRSGADIRLGEYHEDFLVDALITPDDKPVVMLHAQSFDSERRDWARAEFETAHFLWAAEKTRTDAICIVQPPTRADERASASYERVNRWLDHAAVAVVSPSRLPEMARRFESHEQLPLVMAI